DLNNFGELKSKNIIIFVSTIHPNFSTLVLLEIIAYICCFYLLFPIGSSLFSVLCNRRIPARGGMQSDFACVITVYKELDIAWPLVRSLLAQNYPHYHIYLVVDNVSFATAPLEDDRLSILKPRMSLHSKVASIQYILDRMRAQHTHVVIFDPDNLVPAHFLTAIDSYHQAGYPAVQGRRIAKNMDATYAALDAMGEYFYDFTVRKVPFSLGSSSVIAGSGMSVRRDLYEYSISNEVKELKRLGVV